METKTKYWLIGIFIFTLMLRLILAFTIPNLTYSSYFHLRQVESILSTGLPQYSDPLSYGGRELIFLPLFHYFSAIFGSFLPLEIMAKLLSNLLLASITLIIFFIAKKNTGNDTASLVAAFISGILPALFLTNEFGVESLFLPLALLCIYFFQRITEKKYLYLYLVSFAALCFTSAAAVLVIISQVFYLLLLYIEEKKTLSEEREVMLFSLFAYLWVQFIFFKNTFITQGISFIWQNIPNSILHEYFPQITLVKAIGLVSIIPFLAGIITVYRSLFHEKNKKLHLFIGTVIAIGVLTWLRLLAFSFSLSLLSIMLALLFAPFYHEILVYIEKTKWIRLSTLLTVGVVVLLTATILPLSISTALNQATPSDVEIDAFKWLTQYAPDYGAAALLEEGNLVTYYSQKNNLMDTQFALVPNIDQRFKDLSTLYTTSFQTQALEILDKYKLQFIVLTPTAKATYGINKLRYTDGKCFKKVYDEEVKIYRVDCTLGEAGK